jgi:hypothetical protein
MNGRGRGAWGAGRGGMGWSEGSAWGGGGGVNEVVGGVEWGRGLHFQALTFRPHFQAFTFRPSASGPHFQALSFRTSLLGPHFQALSFRLSLSGPQLQASWLCASVLQYPFTLTYLLCPILPVSNTTPVWCAGEAGLSVGGISRL